MPPAVVEAEVLRMFVSTKVWQKDVFIGFFLHILVRRAVLVSEA